MAPSQFSERLGFGLWLRHLVTGTAPTFAEVGRAIGRTGQAVSGWMSAEAPPTDFRVHEPLAAFLELEERWLIRDEGDPPEPELWAKWLGARRPARRAKAAFRPAGSAKKDAPGKRAG